MTSTQSKLFCFGYGYCCDYLGYKLENLDQGWSVSGTTRDPDKQKMMRDHGIKSFIFDYYKPLNDPSLFLDNVTHLLISTPPGNEGDPAFLMHAKDIINLPQLKWIGYLSSTSVYGDRDGEWVDETTEVRPNSQRGSRRVKAEDQWLSLFHDHNLPVHIFRLAGIYGPGRSAIDSIRAGYAQRIHKPGHKFSRIHVEDIARIIYQSMINPLPGQIYNLCDDEAAASHEVIDYACEILGVDPLPLIPYAEADMSPMARSFYSDNKRVKNDKVKKDLNLQLLYPDFKSGLDACLKLEKDLLAEKPIDQTGS